MAEIDVVWSRFIHGDDGSEKKREEEDKEGLHRKVEIARYSGGRKGGLSDAVVGTWERCKKRISDAKYNMSLIEQRRANLREGSVVQITISVQ